MSTGKVAVKFRTITISHCINECFRTEFLSILDNKGNERTNHFHCIFIESHAKKLFYSLMQCKVYISIFSLENHNLPEK